MSDYETDDTLHDSDQDELELDEEQIEKIRVFAEVGLFKDGNGRRQGIIVRNELVEIQLDD
jgi:hypothetical protein